MRIRNYRDFWAGMMFACFGLFFLGFGTSYKFGTAAKMGPGYFPSVVGAILAVLGLAIIAGSLSAKARPESIPGGSAKIVLQILGPIVLFGLLLRPLGLIACPVLLVGLSSLASREHKWRETLLAALVLCLLSYAVFIFALNLQFPVWPAYFRN